MLVHVCLAYKGKLGKVLLEPPFRLMLQSVSFLADSYCSSKGLS